jgi:hypothetical protein
VLSGDRASQIVAAGGRSDRVAALGLVGLVAIAGGMNVGLVGAGAMAAEASATFHQQEYDNPQSTLAIFADTWPGLIEANNQAEAHGFMPLKRAPGVNAPLILNNAELPIPGGKVVASINSGMHSGCHVGSLSQDTASKAFSCPARISIYGDGRVRTVDPGYLCRVGGDTPGSAAHMSYDPRTKTLHFSAVIGGRAVLKSNTGEACDRTISLAQE